MPLRVARRTAARTCDGSLQRLFFEYGGQGRACVFGVDVDIPGDHRLLGQKCAAEIELSADMSVQAILEMLGHDFSEDQLLGEILRGDSDARFLRLQVDEEYKRRIAPRGVRTLQERFMRPRMRLVSLSISSSFFSEAREKTKASFFSSSSSNDSRETGQIARICQVFLVIALRISSVCLLPLGRRTSGLSSAF